MTGQQFVGRIKKVCETRSFASGSSARTFWVQEFNQDKNKDPKYPNILEFEVFTSAKGPSAHYANVTDLDNLKEGQLVRFSWEAKGNVWTNPKTNQERCFVKLSVCSKIDVLGGNGSRNKDVPPPAAPDDFADPDDGPSMPF